MRRLTFVVCGVAAGLAALTACGSATTTGTATATHPQQQQQQQPVHTISDLSQLMAKQTSSVHTAHMAFDAATSEGDVTGTGQIDIEGANSKIQMKLTIPSVGAMNMELLGSSMYLELPAGLVKTPKPWIKFDPSGTDPVSKALAGIVSEEQQDVDPTKAIGQLAGAGTITATGKDTVNGQPATKYAITVDTQKLLNSKLIAPQLKQELQQAGVNLPPTLNYTMWLNSDNLPVKLTVAEKIAGQQINVTVTYSDWGQPVTITAPPADQVGPLPGQ